MPQLLTIAPATANGIDARLPSPGPNPLSVGGEVLFDFGRTLQKIQSASDITEADRISAELTAGVKNTIRQKAIETSDPHQFESDAKEAVTTLRDTMLLNASPEVKKRVADKTAGLFTDAAGDIQFGMAQKQIKAAQGNSTLFLEQKERDLNDSHDPQAMATIQQQIDEHLVDATRVNVYDPAQAMKVRQGILERDAFMRAKNEIDISRRPEEDLVTIAQKYPNLDRTKIANELNGVARARQKEIEKLNKDAEKTVHEENLRDDYLKAVNGNMTFFDFNNTVAARRYTVDEANKLQRAMETGGVTDPRTYTAIEQLIREGRSVDFGTIAQQGGLDRAAKSTLMGLVQQQKEEKHFSKLPEYQEATKEIRSAVSPKGALESFDKVEQARYLAATRELWDRAGKGEDPMAIARDIEGRIAREPTHGEKPLFFPRFQSEQDLISAYKNQQIDRKEFDRQAQLLKQWSEYNKLNAEQAARPSTSAGRR
jgi:hypothetical protein